MCPFQLYHLLPVHLGWVILLPSVFLFIKWGHWYHVLHSVLVMTAWVKPICFLTQNKFYMWNVIIIRFAVSYTLLIADEYFERTCLFLNCTNCSYQRRQWHPTPVLLPGKSHGQRSLVGCSPWSREELDTTERLHFHFSLSCIGEGNGNPLQCSCLENPRDRGAWLAAVYGVAQSRTRLKRLSSSSSRAGMGR